MGERRLDQLIRKGLEWKTGAYSPSIEDQIIEFQERIQGEMLEQDEAEDVERRLRKELENQLKELYDNHILPFEQFNVLRLGNMPGMTREQIRKETGKSPGALRKNIHDAKQTLKRKELWDKFANLFNF